jgi:hypothetical protein
MDAFWRSALWAQFGAAVDMLENAIRACPDALWDDRAPGPPHWYLAYHALFYLDLYLSPGMEGFAPPPPFTLSETDPAGPLPPEVYSKERLLSYLAHGREKCRRVIAALTAERAVRPCGFHWLDMSDGELLLYNMRHVQHHAAQLHLRLRRATASAPAWVPRTARALGTASS